MIYTHDIEGCLSTKIGNNGLDSNTLDLYTKKVIEAKTHLHDGYINCAYPMLQLMPDPSFDWDHLVHLTHAIKSKFEKVLFIGTGGSSLSGQVLNELHIPHHPEIVFLDNVDPLTFEDTIEQCDLKKTFVVIISKSGYTLETISQFILCIDWWRKNSSEESLKEQFLLVTELTDSPMRRLANRFHIPTLPHDKNINGRFSVFSIVGALPALLAGVDFKTLHAGAAYVLENTFSSDSAAPIIGSAVVAGLYEEKKVSNNVLMPYIDHLENFTEWFAQMWAESLGKENRGLTAIRALGTVDQHSQLQLYMDGPLDKLVTIIQAETKKHGRHFADDLVSDSDLAYLKGHTLGDVLDAEQRATANALINNKRPTRIIKIKSLNAESMGALLMHFTLETIFVAHALKINAYDQPAVEHGKVLAKQYLKEHK